MARRSAKLGVPSLIEQFGEMKAGYNAANESRFRRKRAGLPANGSSADFHYTESGYLRMLELARDMDRNDCIVGQTIDRAVLNTLQDGFGLDPQTGDKDLDLDLWHRWDAWTRDPDQCDLSGEHSFHDLACLVLRSVLADGDILALPSIDGPLQLVEGHRLRTPKTSRNVVLGVLIDEHRRHLEYWLTREDVALSQRVSRVGEIDRYPARDAEGFRQVLQIYSPKRYTQTRGVTALAPIVDVAGQFEDINFAKLVQAQVVSCFAIFRSTSPDYLPPLGEQRGERESQTRRDGSVRRIEGLSPGMEYEGAPGETISGFSPNVPNAEFFSHVRLMLTIMGVNLGLPLVLVLLDASETNFSGFRGAVDQARMGFRRNQEMLVTRFYRPVYHWKLRQWMAEDPALRNAAARDGVNIFGHRWNKPNWPYIEPLKDASADLLRQRNALSSPRRIQAERGRDFEEVISETVADNAFAIRLAKQQAAAINGEFADGQPVHWRELVSLPTPDGINVSLAASVNSETSEPSQNDHAD